uniref:CSON003154 protein n=1 Tax=Culicoides sonorensis TaxID=179676 RepID=A0A336MKS5_CULSO
MSKCVRLEKLTEIRRFDDFYSYRPYIILKKGNSRHLTGSSKMASNSELSFCPVCEQENSGQTVKCDGHCQKYFHVKCVGLTFKRAAQLPEWICNNCNAPDASVSFAHTHSSTLVAATQVDQIQENHDKSRRFQTGAIPKAPKENTNKEMVNKNQFNHEQSLHQKTVNASNPFKSASVRSKKSSRSMCSTLTKSSVVDAELSLLEKKANIARQKREMLQAQMKLLDEEQNAIDEALKTVNDLKNSMSEAGSSNSSKESLESESTGLKKLKSLTLKEKMAMYASKMDQSVESMSSHKTYNPSQESDNKMSENSKQMKSPPREPVIFDLSKWTARQTVPQHLSKFAGERGEWASFINAYETSTELCSLSDAENLGRLQKCLAEPARRYVSHLLNDPKNVGKIIETLKMVYGNPKKILKEMFDEIRQHDHIIENDLPSIVKYGLAVQNICAMIKSSRLEGYASNPLILEEIVEKLPKSLQFAWAQAVGDKEISGLNEFDSWLSGLTRNLCKNLGTIDISSADKKQRITIKRRNNTKEDVHVVQDKNFNSDFTCFACSGSCKDLSSCDTFKLLNDDCKWQVIKRHGICRQCLKQHKMKHPFICENGIKCDVANCNGTHHPLMHRDRRPSPKSESSYEHVNYHIHVKNTTVFRYIPVRLMNQSRSVDVIAFLDCGSTGTFLEHATAKELGLKGPKSSLHLKFSGNSHHTENDSMSVSCNISGVHKDAKTYTMNDVHTIKNLNLREQQLQYEQLEKRFDHLKNLPVTSYNRAKPAILIGLRHWKLALEREIRVDDENDSPIASKTEIRRFDEFYSYRPYIILKKGNSRHLTGSSKMASNSELSFCPVCERENSGQTVKCDGHCQKYFHVKCVGLTFKRAAQLPEWICNNCNARDVSVSFAHTHSSTLVAATQVDQIQENHDESRRFQTGAIPKAPKENTNKEMSV